MQNKVVTTNRWWVYQRERFPIFAHSPLLLAFSFSAVSYSSLLRGDLTWPALKSIVTAFITSLLFFLQLRIADEFKDFAEDSQFRPYRPVPSGVVKLEELGFIGVLAAFTQLCFAWWLQPALLILLIIAWVYLALMSVEFFAREWLKARPITYLWTHMLIVPLVDFYATGCDWMALGKSQPEGLWWFLAVSFCNGIVIEIGRKLRAPEDEEVGVQTYTVLWGRKKAVFVWFGAMFATAIFAVLAAIKIDFIVPVISILFVVLSLAAILSLLFIQRPESKRAKLFEVMSGIWTLLMYLSLGAIPMFVKAGVSR